MAAGSEDSAEVRRGTGDEDSHDLGGPAVQQHHPFLPLDERQRFTQHLCVGRSSGAACFLGFHPARGQTKALTVDEGNTKQVRTFAEQAVNEALMHGAMEVVDDHQASPTSTMSGPVMSNPRPSR